MASKSVWQGPRTPLKEAYLRRGNQAPERKGRLVQMVRVAFIKKWTASLPIDFSHMYN